MSDKDTALVVRPLGRAERARFAAGVAALEEGVSYPLGDDAFELDHGEDYFAFFDRLGDVVYYLALDGERVAAVGAAILRVVPGAGEAWYLCDLKVHPAYRGHRVPWKMFSHGFPRYYPRCGRGYGVTMNPPGGRENPVVRLAGRFGKLVSVSADPQLNLYSLDAEEMAAFAPTLQAHRGPLSYLSLAGRKDLILESTGARLPLLHVQHGPCAEDGVAAPVEGHTHMFCAPVGDALDVAAAAEGLAPSATATVLSHRMGGWSWDFILTSDI